MVLFRLFTVSALLITTISLAAEAEPAGKVVSISGRVLVRNEDKATKEKDLKIGDILAKGDVVNTGSTSTVKILMTDKTIIDLAGSTLFKVNEYQLKNVEDRNVNLTMGYGKIRASVNSPVKGNGKFVIKTKAATMGVRGTEFVIASDLKIAETKGPAAKQEVQTQVTVIKGKVEVLDNAKPSAPPIKLDQGKQLTTVANLVGDNVMRAPASAEPPKVVQLNSNQLNNVVSETKIQDQTFKKMIVVDNTTGTSNSSQPSGGSTLAAAVGAGAPPPNFVPPKMSEMQMPGTFTPTTNMVPPMIVFPGAPVNIQVVFNK